MRKLKTHILTALATAFLLWPSAAWAQYNNRTVPNLPQSDLQRWHFGFILGIGFGDFTTTASDYIDAEGHHFASASNGLAPAFQVGMIADLRLVDYLNLRCTPILTLGERKVNYTTFDASGNVVGEQSTVSIKPTTVEIPFYLKYSAKRYGNFRPYVLVGGGPMFNLNLNPEEPILLNVFDVQIGFGFGFMFYTEYFRFCPELKFCFGLLDQLNRNHPEIEGTTNFVYTASVDRLTERILTLSFNFE